MRSSWDEYFLNIAQMVSTRATCNRKHCGAVIVRDRTILSTGYNGSIRGLDHCDDVGHMVVAGHCLRTVHAEVNAISQAAKNGIVTDGSTIYINAFPCWNCFKTCVNAGIIRFVFLDSYKRDENIFSAAEKLGIEMTTLSSENK